MVPLTANTFEIADTAAHALAGTNLATTSASGSGTCVPSTPLVGTSVSNLGAISLTPGDWDVSGSGGFIQFGTTSTTQLTSIISSTPNISTGVATIFPYFGGYTELQGVAFTGAVANVIPTSTVRTLLAATTVEYIEGFAGATSGTAYGFGFIGARRAR
jgi:hypothetical protein